MTKEGRRQKWGFIFHVYEPRGIRHREYTGSAKSKEKAKKEAIKKAKSSRTGIIHRRDGYKIVEETKYEQNPKQ